MNNINSLDILELGLKLDNLSLNQLEIIAESLNLKFEENIKINSINILLKLKTLNTEQFSKVKAIIENTEKENKKNKNLKNKEFVFKPPENINKDKKRNYLDYLKGFNKNENILGKKNQSDLEKEFNFFFKRYKKKPKSQYNNIKDNRDNKDSGTETDVEKDRAVS
jgi:hypothetical protein